MKKQTKTLAWLAGGAAVAYLLMRKNGTGLAGLIKPSEAFRLDIFKVRRFDFAALLEKPSEYQQAFAQQFAELLAPADVVSTTQVASYVCGVDDSSEQCKLANRVLAEKIKSANAAQVATLLKVKSALPMSVTNIVNAGIRARLNP